MHIEIVVNERNMFFLQLTLFLLSRAMHKLLNLAFDSLSRCFLSEFVNLLFGPRFELDSDMFLSLTTISIRMRSVQVQQRLYEYGKSSVGIIA